MVDKARMHPCMGPGLIPCRGRFADVSGARHPTWSFPPMWHPSSPPRPDSQLQSIERRMQELSGREQEAGMDRPALISKFMELQAERAQILCEDSGGAASVPLTAPSPLMGLEAHHF